MSDTFDMKQIMKKIVRELDEKIEKIRKPRPNEKERYSKSGFFVAVANNDIKFPISKDTYYCYSAFAKNRKSSKPLQSIDLRKFFDICTYTDISADYLLGFIKTKRKEQSAEMVRKEYGLSDKSMRNLIAIKNRKAEAQGELSSDIMNFILENSEFWNKLNNRLPVYLTCLDYRGEDIDIDVTRYGIIRAFEELLDELCDDIKKKNLPIVVLDETTPFPSQK